MCILNDLAIMMRTKTNPMTLIILLFLLYVQATTAGETYTNAACRAVASQIGACASRWESIRVECKNKVTTNTVWPGPCECAYYSNDLPCFDEQEFCAEQAWTQQPQWFRDGVTSCLMKDASFTVRAQLGSESGRFGNPFTVAGLAGNATRTASPIATSTPARAGGSLPTATNVDTAPSETVFSVGAKAGFGVGIGVGVILTVVMAVMVVRNRRKSMPARDVEAKKMQTSELHNDEYVHQMSSGAVYPKNEMEGCVPQHELGGANIAELPEKQSRRQSRR